MTIANPVLKNALEAYMYNKLWSKATYAVKDIEITNILHRDRGDDSSNPDAILTVNGEPTEFIFNTIFKLTLLEGVVKVMEVEVSADLDDAARELFVLSGGRAVSHILGKCDLDFVDTELHEEENKGISQRAQYAIEAQIHEWLKR